jgi:hypothetical protein
VTPWRAATLAVALAAGTQALASAQPTEATRGTVGHGRLAIDVTNPKGTHLAISGEMGFEQRGDALRLDLASLGLTNAGASVQFLPPGGVTLVIDRKSQRYVVWSASRHVFAWGDLPKPPSPLAPAAQAETPAPAPSGSPPPQRSPFDGLKNLKAFSLGVDLSGHGVAAGHPTTDFAYHLHSESNEGKVNDLNGTFQSADDLHGLPVAFTLNVAAASGAKVALSAELTSIERRDPAKLDFLVPAGFTAVRSPLQVIFPNGAPIGLP